MTPENAQFFHMSEANGAVISQIEPDSAGAKAGLKVGDVITEFNGKKVESRTASGPGKPGVTRPEGYAGN